MPPLKILRNRWKQNQEALIELVARVHSCLLAGEYDRGRPGSKYYYKKMLELAERDPELYRELGLFAVTDGHDRPLDNPVDAEVLQDVLLNGVLIESLADWASDGHSARRGCSEVDDILKEHKRLQGLA